VTVLNRKTWTNGKSLSDDDFVDTTQDLRPSKHRKPKYAAMIDFADELPYVVVRPKVNPKKSDKKVMSLRNFWD